MIIVSARPPVTEELEEPYTCEDEGWSEWYNLHSPDSDGEFESLSEIRKASRIDCIVVIDVTGAFLCVVLAMWLSRPLKSYFFQLFLFQRLIFFHS